MREREARAVSIADGEVYSAAPAADDQVNQNLERIRAIANAFRKPPRTPRASLFEWQHLHIEHKLGEGGFGEVFQAWDPVLKRHVALKLSRAPRAGLDNRLIIAEARRMARVRHPNILAIHGADEDAERAGIWSDLIDGDTLDMLVARQGALTLEAALELAVPLADALTLIHDRGLIHGDIKPGNVMLRGSGEPVLMDFGGTLDGQSNVLGSPIAMAPEQFDTMRPSMAADVYAFGVMLYFVLCGEYPLAADDVDELVQAHRGGRQPVLDQLPGPLRNLVGRCLHQQADQRPDAQQLHAHLRHVMQRPQRRQRQIMLGLAGSGLVLALVASSFGWYRTELARDEAEQERQRAQRSLDFLTEMLEAPKVSERGTDVRMEEILDVAARQLKASASGQDLPGLHLVLARTYDSLEQRDKARQQYIAAERAATTPQDNFDALLARSWFETDVDQFDVAHGYLEQAEELVATVAEMTDQRAYVTLQRARLLDAQTRHAEALALFESLSEPGTFPADSPSNWHVWQNLVTLLRDATRFEEAIAAGDRALAWQAEFGGGMDTLDAMVTRHNVASLHILMGNPVRAEQLARQNVDFLDRMAPGWNQRRLRISNTLVDAIAKQGRLDEAIEQTELLYQQAVQADSPDSEIAMTISGMLGARYFDAGRLAEAHDITERALAIAIDIYGDGSQRVQLWRSNLAEFKVYLKLGEPALQYAAQTYQTNADLLGKDHLYTLFMADVYGLAQVRWGDVQSGLTLLQETVQMKRDKFGPEHAFVRDTEIYLVEALFLSADMDGARDLALRLQTAIAANKSIHRVKSDLLESLLEKIN